MADERRLYERKQVVVRIWTSVANPTNPGAMLVMYQLKHRENMGNI